MRNLGGVLGAALLVAACGSSKTPGGSTTGGGTTSGEPLAHAGEPCTSDAACLSGTCGKAAEGGVGNCCAKACGNDRLCGATGCDSTGACIYPAANTACGTVCTGSLLQNRICNGAGVCQFGTGAACPENLGCADGGEVCNETCAAPLDCAVNFTCRDGGCIPRFKTGPCSSDFDCVSEVCGADGTGNCCTAACNSTVAPCGAADCDQATGVCLYVDAGTQCGAAPCVPGAAGQTLCDGQGHCSLKSCAPFLCGPGACQTTCTEFTSSCSPDAFCDLQTSACCAGLVDGGSMKVDSVLGSDALPCCGYGGAAPCKTLKHVMALIGEAAAPNVTITATVNGGPGDWAPQGEASPVPIGWGAELIASGVFFSALDISTATDGGGVWEESVVGTTRLPVGVGVTAEGQPYDAAVTIEVHPGHTLYLANAKVIGTGVGGYAIGIELQGNAGLVLGEDRSSAVAGTVQVGDPTITALPSSGLYGILCGGDCTIRDAALTEGVSSVVIQGQEGVDLRAGGNSVISLTSAPSIGVVPTSNGFGTCPDKRDMGIVLEGRARMTFANGSVECCQGDGFDLVGDDGGGPTLTLSNTTIQNTNAGVDVTGGTATVANSKIWFNYQGVVQAGGTIDLSGGAMGGTNTVACANKSEWDGFGNLPTIPGVAVLNETSATLNASNVNWDTPGPDLFSCDAGLVDCTCEIANCVNPGGVDGMDAVTDSTGTITTTGNGPANVTCSSIPP